MSAARLKRIAALEARRPTAAPWSDPFDLCMSIWAALKANLDATKAGREFSRLPSPEPTPESAALLAVVLRDADRIHERLAAEAAGERR
jgi:TorA maturation chaperone TorD